MQDSVIRVIPVTMLFDFSFYLLFSFDIKWLHNDLKYFNLITPVLLLGMILGVLSVTMSFLPAFASLSQSDNVMVSLKYDSETFIQNFIVLLLSDWRLLPSS